MIHKVHIVQSRALEQAVYDAKWKGCRHGDESKYNFSSAVFKKSKAKGMQSALMILVLV